MHFDYAQYRQKGFSLISIIIAVILILVLGGIAYQVNSKQNQKVQKLVEENIIPSSQPPQLIPSTDETVNWKTYTNTKYGYLIKYPSEIRLVSSNEDAVELYRENVNIGAGRGERGHGMTIYYRNFGAETIENQTRPTENISVSSYPALRRTDNNLCMEDIWLPNPNKENTLRISFTTCAEKDPYNKTDFDLFNQILSTFKFLE